MQIIFIFVLRINTTYYLSKFCFVFNLYFIGLGVHVF